MSLYIREHIELDRLFSFRFISKRGEFMDRKDIEKFRDYSIKNPKEFKEYAAIEFDKPAATWSFDKFFSERHLPLLIETNNEGNKKITVNNGRDFFIIKNIQIRVTEYGVGSVRVSVTLPLSKKTPTYKVVNIIERGINEEEEIGKIAKKIWEDFLGKWNQFLERMERSREHIENKEVIHLSKYLIIFAEDIVTDKNKDICNELMRVDKMIMGDKKELIGISIASYMWPEYSQNFVDKFLQKDVSTTNNELIFVDNPTTFFYFHKGIEKEEYLKYLKDMKLGLELLFIIQNSLKIIDKELRERLTEIRLGLEGSIKFSAKVFVDIPKLLGTLHQKMLVFSSMRDIHTRATITHFRNFIKAVYKNMMIDDLIESIEREISTIEKVATIHFSQITTILMGVLTILIVAIGIIGLLW